MKFAGTYHAIASAETTAVETWGVLKRAWTLESACGNAAERAIENAVREAGMIVVCVDATAEVTIARMTSLSQGDPSTSAPSVPKIASSSSNSASSSSPANATTAVA